MDYIIYKFPDNTLKQKSWSYWARTPPVFFDLKAAWPHLNEPTILELIGNSASIAQPQEARLNQQDLNQNEKNLDLQKLNQSVCAKHFAMDLLHFILWYIVASFSVQT